MSLLRSNLNHVISYELDNFKDVFDQCLKDNKPFDYLEVVAHHYNCSKESVFDEALDSFSYYLSHGAKKDHALIWSLQRTHEVVLETYLTQQKK